MRVQGAIKANTFERMQPTLRQVPPESQYLEINAYPGTILRKYKIQTLILNKVRNQCIP